MSSSGVRQEKAKDELLVNNDPHEPCCFRFSLPWFEKFAKHKRWDSRVLHLRNTGLIREMVWYDGR